MKEENFEEREFSGLERRLRGADLSADSRVKDVLLARLQARARRPAWRAPVLAWLAPAFAAGALFFMFGPGNRPAEPAAVAYAAAYALPDDGYGACGRQGLEDFQAGERF